MKKLILAFLVISGALFAADQSEGFDKMRERVGRFLAKERAGFGAGMPAAASEAACLQEPLPNCCGLPYWKEACPDSLLKDMHRPLGGHHFNYAVLDANTFPIVSSFAHCGCGNSQCSVPYLPDVPRKDGKQESLDIDNLLRLVESHTNYKDRVKKLESDARDLQLKKAQKIANHLSAGSRKSSTHAVHYSVAQSPQSRIVVVYSHCGCENPYCDHERRGESRCGLEESTVYWPKGMDVGEYHSGMWDLGTRGKPRKPFYDPHIYDPEIVQFYFAANLKDENPKSESGAAAAADTKS